MQHHTPHTWWVHFISGQKGQMAVGEKGKQLAELAEVIMDDILIWGSTLEEPDQRLKKVLDKAQKHNLKLSPNKCEFRKKEITYVGHVLSFQGLKSRLWETQGSRTNERTWKQERTAALSWIYPIPSKVPSKYVGSISSFKRIVIQGYRMALGHSARK